MTVNNNRPTFREARAQQGAQTDRLRGQLEENHAIAEHHGDARLMKETSRQLEDLDKDELITSHGVREAAKASGLSENAINQAIARYNADGDGLFDEGEFDALMGELAKPEAKGATATAQASAKSPAAVPRDKVGAVLNAPASHLPSADELKKAGVSGARLTLAAGYLAPAEKMQEMKAKLTEYQKAGIDVTVHLGGELAEGQPTPELQHNRGPVKDEQSPAWNQQFDNWVKGSYLPAVKNVMDQLGPCINNIEVMNEPDEQNNRRQGPNSATDPNDIEYIPGLPPATFGKLMKSTYETIHSHPNAKRDVAGGEKQMKVLTGGLDSGRPDWLQKAGEATPDPKTGKPMIYADALGVHPYAKDPTVTDESQDNSLRRIMKAYENLDLKVGPNEPDGAKHEIYNTEASVGPGSPDNPEDVKAAANYAENFARESTNLDSVKRSYFFWGGTYDNHLGMVDQQGKPTKLFEALSRVTGADKE
jgi:hypothetical protein